MPHHANFNKVNSQISLLFLRRAIQTKNKVEDVEMTAKLDDTARITTDTNGETGVHSL